MRALLVAVLVSLALATPARAAGLGVQISHNQERGDEGQDSDAYGVFARLGLIGPLHLYVELAKMSYDEAEDRRDRRLGVGVQLDIPGLGDWVPMLLAGTGVQEAANPEGDGYLYYTELGLGLAYRLTDNLRLELDLRRGSLARFEQEKDGTGVPRSIMATDQRDYRAGRLSMALEF